MINWKRTQQNLKYEGHDPGTVDGQPGALTYRALLAAAGPSSNQADFGTAAGLLAATVLPAYGIDASADALTQFLCNTGHETGDYTVFSENLTYTTPAALVRAWPTRFNLVTAVPYLRRPQALAEKVYGGRMGNPPGRAYDYRGGGWIQLTGFDAYAAAQTATGLPLVAHPDLLHDPLTGLKPAAAFWQARGCNDLAAADPTGNRARRAVNGGIVGLADVLTRVARLRPLVAEA